MWWIFKIIYVMQLINVIYNITYNNLYLMFPKNICSDLD